ncbi:hypothetical protein [Aquimarina longa]|uniref:hypothetical protein n=1 Tax=Aquimarina longa TaxID=1080221 RepID=UPI000782E767|nr:hypothetical protein [Aquimarina longa]
MAKYRQHIASFFAILFLVSQVSHVVHCSTDHYQLNKNEIFAIYNSLDSFIHDDNVVINQNFDDCTLCFQHNSLKFYSTSKDIFDISPNEKSLQKITIKYSTPFLNEYLLTLTSLRAPPFSLA